MKVQSNCLKEERAETKASEEEKVLLLDEKKEWGVVPQRGEQRE